MRSDLAFAESLSVRSECVCITDTLARILIEVLPAYQVLLKILRDFTEVLLLALPSLSSSTALTL